jgi:hypothetical protein
MPNRQNEVGSVSLRLVKLQNQVDTTNKVSARRKVDISALATTFARSSGKVEKNRKSTYASPNDKPTMDA